MSHPTVVPDRLPKPEDVKKHREMVKVKSNKEKAIVDILELSNYELNRSDIECILNNYWNE